MHPFRCFSKLVLSLRFELNKLSEAYNVASVSVVMYISACAEGSGECPRDESDAGSRSRVGKH